MILVCDRCKASFLIPSSLLAAGPRPVRCGRCGHVWTAEREAPETEAPPPPPPSAPPPPLRPAPPIQPVPPAAAVQVQPPPPEPATSEEKPRFSLRKELQTLFAKLKLIPWKNIGLRIGLATGGTLLLTALIFVFGHGPLIRTWPGLQPIYVSLGLATEPLKDKLVLRGVRSERRYMDGAMHLVVTGEIFSQAKKTQVIPTILVEALGPDGQLIQSWHIAPPTATLRPGRAAPFFSAILSPEGTVVEVNLSFVHPPHDDDS